MPSCRVACAARRRRRRRKICLAVRGRGWDYVGGAGRGCGGWILHVASAWSVCTVSTANRQPVKPSILKTETPTCLPLCAPMPGGCPPLFVCLQLPRPSLTGEASKYNPFSH
ncbi:hypothetical protein DAI22_02g207600 [Oryza sativa Japonica Group]|nr:hypothetical protein DAI22_02g207600 [Oryza sativa Japonica Group]